MCCVICVIILHMIIQITYSDYCGFQMKSLYNCFFSSQNGHIVFVRPIDRRTALSGFTSNKFMIFKLS